MSDDLKLNRLSKQGRGLILEEHSHCEVPAGCGGVVLRWVRPGAPTRLWISTFPGKSVDAWLDGTPVEYMRVLVKPGEHVLAIRLEATAKTRLLVSVKDMLRRIPERHLGSAGDGTWRCAWDAPALVWTEPSFDDSAWNPMEASEIRDARDGTNNWLLNSLRKDGAVPLKPPSPGSSKGLSKRPLFVRRRFVVDAEGLR